MNRIRRDNPALQSNQSLHFHPSTNPEIICYSKGHGRLSNAVLVVVNLSPPSPPTGWVELQLDALGLSPHSPIRCTTN